MKESKKYFKEFKNASLKTANWVKEKKFLWRLQIFLPLSDQRSERKCSTSFNNCAKCNYFPWQLFSPLIVLWFCKLFMARWEIVRNIALQSTINTRFALLDERRLDTTENAIKLASLHSIVTHPHDIRFFHHLLFMHKFIKFSIVCNWKSMKLYVKSIPMALFISFPLFRQSLSSFSIFNQVYCFHSLYSSLGGRQSASDANKLIIWMMSVRDKNHFWLLSSSIFVFLPSSLGF